MAASFISAAHGVFAMSSEAGRIREAAALVADQFAQPNGHPRTQFDLGYENSARKIAARIRALPIEENLYTSDERVKETADSLLVPPADVVMVPREPTEAMIDRFVSRALCVSIDSSNGGWSQYARDQWHAMLSALETRP